MAVRRWVAKLICNHTAGGTSREWPVRDDYVHCSQCQAPRLVRDVVTDEYLSGPDGKRW